MDIRRQKELFLELFPRKNFHIARVCREMKMSRQTLYNWKARDAEFAERMRELEESDIDDSEDSLRTLRKGIPKRDDEGNFIGWITKPDVTAIIFHLKTKGKARGYIESSHVDNSGIIQFEQAIDFSKLSDETIKELYDAQRIDANNESSGK
jgi:hypothetical protein